MDCAIRIAKTKALISCAVTAQLICVFVFTFVKSRFSPNEAHFKIWNPKFQCMLSGTLPCTDLKMDNH